MRLGSMSPAVAAYQAEKVCALWTAGKNQVELNMAHKDGHSERKLFTTTPLGDANHITCIFQAHTGFRRPMLEVCQGKIWQDGACLWCTWIFEPSFDATAVEVDNSVVVLAEFHRVQADTLAPGFRRLMGNKTALQQDNPDLKLGKNRDRLMAQVLSHAVEHMQCHPSEMHMKTGIGYMFFRAQSAQCESVLSKRAYVKRVLQNAEVWLINTYASVQSNIPAGLRTAEAVALVRDLTSKFAKCDRHRSTPHSTVHGKVGKAARPRMRAQRSDKGTSGKRKYTRRGTLP